MEDKKRLLREEKRQIKKDGNRSRRRSLQRQLLDDPENAHEFDFEFDEYNSSVRLNGIDQDKRRQQEAYEQEMYGTDNEEEREQY